MAYRTAAPEVAESTPVEGPMSPDQFVRVCERLKAAYEDTFDIFHQEGTIRVPHQCRDSFKASGCIKGGKRLYGRTSPG